MRIFSLMNTCARSIRLIHRHVSQMIHVSCCLSLLLSATTQALTVDEARHLLQRTGFGASPAEIHQLLPLSREQAVDHILNGLKHQAISPPPAFVSEPLPNYWYVQENKLNNKESEKFRFTRIREMNQLRIWWIDQMISTPSPLTERLVLFWHNHFVSSYFKTRLTKPFYDQQMLFRTLGTTNFADLAHAMIRDPALMIYLDNNLNTKNRPNENLAREFMELFTLGVDQYTQKDVVALAKILAGHTVDHKTWTYTFDRSQSVPGQKTFLGETKDFTLDEAVDRILAQPQAARFISQKFFREFISLNPDQPTIDQLADVLRQHHYDLKPFLRALFLSKAFWLPKNRDSLIKSPIDLIVGFSRTFGVHYDDMEALADYSRQLGQELFQLPNVAGWQGGESWLNQSKMTARRQAVNRLWDAYEDSQQIQTRHPNDLLVRVSGEFDGRQQPKLQVLVNNQVYYQGRLHTAVNTVTDGSTQFQSRPKPMWTTIRIPRERLPKSITSIDVAFKRPMAWYPCDLKQPQVDLKNNDHLKTSQYPLCVHIPQNVLFINWIQVDKQRYPIEYAKRHFSPGDSCGEAGVPMGMLYCDAYENFNIRKLKTLYQGKNPQLVDIQNIIARINDVVEHGTTHMKLLNQPAARPHNQPTDILAELKKYQLTSSLVPTLLAVKPFQSMPMQLTQVSSNSASPGTMPAMSPAELMHTIKAMTLDPTYNLK